MGRITNALRLLTQPADDPAAAVPSQPTPADRSGTSAAEHGSSEKLPWSWAGDDSPGLPAISWQFPDVTPPAERREAPSPASQAEPRDWTTRPVAADAPGIWDGPQPTDGRNRAALRASTDDWNDSSLPGGEFSPVSFHGPDPRFQGDARRSTPGSEPSGGEVAPSDETGPAGYERPLGWRPNSFSRDDQAAFDEAAFLRGESYSGHDDGDAEFGPPTEAWNNPDLDDVWSKYCREIPAGEFTSNLVADGRFDDGPSAIADSVMAGLEYSIQATDALLDELALTVPSDAPAISASGVWCESVDLPEVESTSISFAELPLQVHLDAEESRSSQEATPPVAATSPRSVSPTGSSTAPTAKQEAASPTVERVSPVVAAVIDLQAARTTLDMQPQAVMAVQVPKSPWAQFTALTATTRAEGDQWIEVELQLEQPVAPIHSQKPSNAATDSATATTATVPAPVTSHARDGRKSSGEALQREETTPAETPVVSSPRSELASTTAAAAEPRAQAPPASPAEDVPGASPSPSTSPSPTASRAAVWGLTQTADEDFWSDDDVTADGDEESYDPVIHPLVELDVEPDLRFLQSTADLRRGLPQTSPLMGSVSDGQAAGEEEEDLVVDMPVARPVRVADIDTEEEWEIERVLNDAQRQIEPWKSASPQHPAELKTVAAPTPYEKRLLAELDEAVAQTQVRHVVELIHQQLAPDRSQTVLLLCPPGDGEVADMVANLGIMLARDDFARVLLIDANFQAATLSERFGAPREGVLEYCLDNESLAGLIRPTSLSGLHLLPCGDILSARGVHFQTDEIVRLRRLIAECREGYDYLLIDAGQLGQALTDQLVDVADGVFLQVALGRTGEREAAGAIERLQQLGGRVLGCLVDTAIPNGR